MDILLLIQHMNSQKQFKKGELDMTKKKKKKRSDYKFWINTADCFRKDLINGSFSSWYEDDEEDGVFERGIAVLEIGWVDIELNICSAWCDKHACYVNKIVPSYFICVKGNPEPGVTEWNPAGYLDDFGYKVDVDWSDEKWEKKLEKDMLKNLLKAIDQFNLKTDEPNWKGDNNPYFDVFNRINKEENLI